MGTCCSRFCRRSHTRKTSSRDSSGAGAIFTIVSWQIGCATNLEDSQRLRDQRGCPAVSPRTPLRHEPGSHHSRTVRSSRDSGQRSRVDGGCHPLRRGGGRLLAISRVASGAGLGPSSADVSGQSGSASAVRQDPTVARRGSQATCHGGLEDVEPHKVPVTDEPEEDESCNPPSTVPPSSTETNVELSVWEPREEMFLSNWDLVMWQIQRRNIWSTRMQARRHRRLGSLARDLDITKDDGGTALSCGSGKCTRANSRTTGQRSTVLQATCVPTATAHKQQQERPGPLKDRTVFSWVGGWCRLTCKPSSENSSQSGNFRRSTPSPRAPNKLNNNGEPLHRLTEETQHFTEERGTRSPRSGEAS